MPDIALIVALVTVIAALVAEANRLAPRGSAGRQLFRFFTARRAEYTARGWRAMVVARATLPVVVFLIVLAVLVGV